MQPPLGPHTPGSQSKNSIPEYPSVFDRNSLKEVGVVREEQRAYREFL
jgi:hypothetical protein